MSMYYRENGCCEVKTYNDGRTKQAFKDETDINTILKKYQVSGVISHMAKFQASYGDFNDYDFLGNQLIMQKGEEMFAALPSEVRREFDQDMSSFFAYVNDPANKDRLKTLLPGIAETGDYFPDVSSKTPPDALLSGGEPGEVIKEVAKDVVQDPKDAV